MGKAVESGSERIIISILKTLNESSEPLGSTTISRKLKQDGVFLGERGVRYHLKIADLRGYTRSLGRDGRLITPEGRQEIKEAFATQQLGFVREKKAAAHHAGRCLCGCQEYQVNHRCKAETAV